MKQAMHRACLLVGSNVQPAKPSFLISSCLSRICGDMPIAQFHAQKFYLSTVGEWKVSQTMLLCVRLVQCLFTKESDILITTFGGPIGLKKKYQPCKGPRI